MIYNFANEPLPQSQIWNEPEMLKVFQNTNLPTAFVSQLKRALTEAYDFLDFMRTNVWLHKGTELTLDAVCEWQYDCDAYGVEICLNYATDQQKDEFIALVKNIYQNLHDFDDWAQLFVSFYDHNNQTEIDSFVIDDFDDEDDE